VKKIKLNLQQNANVVMIISLRCMGVGSGGQGGARTPSPWIFIHGTDIVLIVLFFGLLLFFVAPLPPP